MIIAPEISRETWLKMRFRTIGASEAAAALGESPWKSPLELWAEKTGLLEPADLSDIEAVRFGHVFEQSIVAEGARRSNSTLMLDCEAITRLLTSDGSCYVVGWVDGQPMLASSKFPWMSVTLDGVSVDERGRLVLMEAKNVGEYNAEDWEDGRAPDWYMLQAYHALAVVQSASAVRLCAVIGGNKYREVVVERDCAPINAVVELERQFWLKVKENQPPAADGSPSSRRVLNKLHPDDDGTTVVIDAETARLHARLQELKEIVKGAKEELDTIETQFRAALGSHTYGELPDGAGCYSLKTTERAGYTVAPTKFRTLRFSNPKKK